MSINEELLGCAKINFENFEKACPEIKNHPFWLIAYAQLCEGLGYQKVHETLSISEDGQKLDG